MRELFYLTTALTLASPSLAQPLPGTLLPPGPLHTSGSQIVDQRNRPVRLACVGWFGPDSVGGAPMGWNRMPTEKHLLVMMQQGFNCVRLPWNDAGFDSSMNYAKQLVDAARPLGMRVILDHHTNDGGTNNWGGQQPNGLWFDSGPGTDGTDGAGHRGTVTAQKFQENWVRIARMFAGDQTVIGFDLANEPLNNNANWGKGGPTDIWAMYTTVGNAIHAVNRDVLIICAGLLSYNAGLPEGDLTAVSTKPVVLYVPNKVVYTVHEYPPETNKWNIYSGQAYIDQMNRAWGHLITQNIAPVWVGEMGASMNKPEDKAWADTIVPYLNGTAHGGLIPAGGQGVSTGWWTHGSLDGQVPNGTLQSDWLSARPEQAAVYTALQMKRLTTGDITTVSPARPQPAR